MIGKSPRGTASASRCSSRLSSSSVVRVRSATCADGPCEARASEMASAAFDSAEPRPSATESQRCAFSRRTSDHVVLAIGSVGGDPPRTHRVPLP